MSKGKHGNKEAKKPKQAPAVKSPIADTAVPAPAVGKRPSSPKK